MRRRDFIAGLGGAAAASAGSPLAARAQQRGQQPALPVVGIVSFASAPFVELTAALTKGLGESGYVDGQNVTLEYHWLENRFDRVAALMADLVLRRVAVIATPNGETAAPSTAGQLRSTTGRYIMKACVQKRRKEETAQ
jgi:putative tryptophan/tyrosine transport system substrate-binding protein